MSAEKAPPLPSEAPRARKGHPVIPWPRDAQGRAYDERRGVRGAYLPEGYGAGVVLDPQAWRDRQRREMKREQRREERAAQGWTEDTRLRGADLRRAVLHLGYRAKTADDPATAERYRQTAYGWLRQAQPQDRDSGWFAFRRGEWVAELGQQMAVVMKQRRRRILECERKHRRDRAREELTGDVPAELRDFLDGWFRSDSHDWKTQDQILDLRAELLRCFRFRPEDFEREAFQAMATGDLELDAVLAEACAAWGALAVQSPRRIQERAWELPPNPWHTARAEGASRRFQSVGSCGLMGHIVLRCRACGHEHKVPIGCGHRLICPVCRKSKARAYQGELRRAMLGVIRAADRAGLLYDGRRNEKRDRRAEALGVQTIGERFLTITVPHFPDDTVAERLDRLSAAWSWMLRRINEYQRQVMGGGRLMRMHAPDGGRVAARPIDLCHHVSVLEVTEGADGRGHPHRHCWHFGPRLPHRLLESWLLEGLLRACPKCRKARAAGELGRVIVDVRGIKNGYVAGQRGKGSPQKVEAELYKYLVKDWTERAGRQGELVAPDLMAQILTWLEGRRMRQTSAGFKHWQIGTWKPCQECGHRVAPEVRIQKAEGIDPAERFSALANLGDAWEPPPTAPALGALAASVPSAKDRALREGYGIGWWVNLEKEHPGIGDRLQALADSLNPDRSAPALPVHSGSLDSQLKLWGQKDTDA